MTELSFDTTESDEEDDETAEGWSLADAFNIYSETESSWSAHTGGRALLVRVRATPKAGAPGKPSTLTATASGRHRIDLSWTAPLDGGSEITGYRIESSSDGSTGWSDLVADTASTATSHSDTGLRPNTTRHYRVSAINSLGASPASDPAFDTTGDFPDVTVQYGQSDYTVAEGGTLEVTVTLSEDPLQETVIPIAATGQDGATSADYSVPSSVTFGEGDTSKTITFAATNDTEDDDDESVLLSFGSVLPDRVSEGSPNEATVNIADDDDPPRDRNVRPGRLCRRRGRNGPGAGGAERQPGTHGGHPLDGNQPGRSLVHRLFRRALQRHSVRRRHLPHL